MAKYFTLDELISSDTAKAKKIANVPTANEMYSLVQLIDNVLDPIRERWGKPIYVNSGFRCKRLNEAVKGASNSQHMKGEAADIDTHSIEGNKKLFNMIVEMQRNGAIRFDQLIDERGYSWLHVSYSTNNRNQILHLK